MGALPEGARKRLASQVHEEIARQGWILPLVEEAVLRTSQDPIALMYALRAIDEKLGPSEVEPQKNLAAVQDELSLQDAAELSTVQILVLVFRLWLILIAIPVALLILPAAAVAMINSEVGTMGGSPWVSRP